MEPNLDEARAQIAGLADAGVSLDAITQKFQDDGVDDIARAFEILVNSINEKRRKFLSGR